MQRLVILLTLCSITLGSWASASPIPPNPEVWVMSSDGTEQRALPDSMGDRYFGTDASWAPDSSRVVVSGLAVIDVETGEVTDLGSGRGPDWSPTGDQIVFSDTSSADGSYDEMLFMVDADGTDRRLLVDTPSLDGNPAWSPDGTQVAFVSGPGGGGEGHLFVVDSDGSDLRRVTSGGALYTAPVWSHDGRRLAFDTFDHDVFVVDADGNNERPLGFDYSAQPTWCPDGTLYFAGHQIDGPDWGIYVMDQRGAFEFMGPGGVPDCNTAGRVAFARDGDIHVVDPGEAGSPNLTATADRSDSYPRWSPDGSKIAYSSTPRMPPPKKVEREITLSLRKHLVASGRLKLAAESDCYYTPIRLQRIAGGGWKTIESFSSSFEGDFRIRIRDREGFYRAVAPRSYSAWHDWECQRAVSDIVRHRH